MGKKIQIRNSTAEFLIFTNQAREDGIEVRLQDDTIWLSQKLMATLFDCSTDNIGLHLKNIYNEGELDEKSTTELFSVVATNGKTYNTKHYNLDAIIAVGYRVNSKKATAFRRWATSILRDYAIMTFEFLQKKEPSPDKAAKVSFYFQGLGSPSVNSRIRRLFWSG